MLRVLGFVLLAGCVPTSFTYSPSFARGPAAKPEGCPFEVVTSAPPQDFQEVGTLDFYNGDEPTSVDGFKKAVAKQVCQVGGDAVIAIANPKGQYTKGTVVHYNR